MNITNARASIGLNCKVTPVSTNTSGTLQVGASNASVAIENPKSAYCLRAFMAVGSSFDINLLNGTISGALPAFVAGAAQVETATAVGTVTGAGNASIVVTAAGMTGSPLTIPFAVAVSDTPTQWAAKARTALNANAAVAAMFVAGGTSDAITLTRKPVQSITAGNVVVNHYAANDTTLNLALATGTATGITAAPTSANTIPGTASVGVKIYDDATDFEGVPLISATPVCVQFATTGLGVVYVGEGVAAAADFFQIRPGGTVILAGNGVEAVSVLDTTVKITADVSSSDLIVTVISKTP